jgi:hypothetical protein
LNIILYLQQQAVADICGYPEQAGDFTPRCSDQPVDQW